VDRPAGIVAVAPIDEQREHPSGSVTEIVPLGKKFTYRERFAVGLPLAAAAAINNPAPNAIEESKRAERISTHGGYR